MHAKYCKVMIHHYAQRGTATFMAGSILLRHKQTDVFYCILGGFVSHFCSIKTSIQVALMASFFLHMQGFATRNICWTFGAYGFGSLVVHEKSPYFREIQLGEMPIDSDSCPLPFPKKFCYFVCFLFEEVFFWFMEPLSSKLLESRALLSKRISPSGFPK